LDVHKLHEQRKIPAVISRKEQGGTVPKRNIIVIGGSMGSFEVFKTIAEKLPHDLEASVFIVWHVSPDVRGILPQILSRLGPLPAVEAQDCENILPGYIYVARPDHHLLIENSHVRVTRGPKENRFRPAIDPLFRSAAYAYGPRVIGVVSSGALDDGTSGLWEIKRRGGIAVVQDPFEAEMPSMPESAIHEVDVDHIVKSDEIAGLITRLSREEVDVHKEVHMQDETENKKTRDEIRIAAEASAFESSVFANGEMTPFTCPECNGVLARLRDGDRPRFRCHTGHAFSPDSLLAALTENIEESLWSAIRGVDESIMLLNHLGDHFAETNNGRLAAQCFKKANEAQSRNERIRQVVRDHELLTMDSVEQDAEDKPANRAADAR
jgi:two-component system chemotaxis response regulator CheB